MRQPTKAQVLDWYKSPQDVLDTVREVSQNVYSEVATRHVDAPSSHHPWKVVPAFWGTIATAFHQSVAQRDESRTVNMTSIYCASVQKKYDWPTYFVSRPLLEAMRRTKPPDNLTWEDVHFRFPSIGFILPRGIIAEDGTELCYLSVTVVQHLPEVLKLVGGGYTMTRVTDWTKNRLCVIAGSHHGSLGNATVFPIDQKLQVPSDWIEEATADSVSRGWIREDLTSDLRWSPSAASDITALVGNLLLYMECRPDGVETGAKTGKKLKHGAVVHSPSWVGRKYEIQRKERGAATGAHFTELGWRGGYYAVRWVGHGKEKREKKVLVDPYMAYMRGLVRCDGE